MQNFNKAPIVSVKASLAPLFPEYQKQLDLEATKLLTDYRAGDTLAREKFRNRHPTGKKEGFTPTQMDARQVIMFQNVEGQKLSLEKLKKIAKQLLKDVKAGDPLALHRMTTMHPKIKADTRQVTDLTLADIQHVLALEAGFESWPKLKHHLQAMGAASLLVKSRTPLDTARSLHIRCGEDIKDALKTAGLHGQFMEVSNPFSMGPVYPQRLEAKSLQARSEYIQDILGPYLPKERSENISQSLKEEELALQTLAGQFEEVTLWFEHDAYDQLCCAYILHHMAAKGPDLPFKLDLVQVDRFPGVKRFVGIGQLCHQPESLALLYQQRISVSPDMIKFGAAMWDAFTSSEPTRLWQLCRVKNAPLPLMQNAMLRMLAELPSPKNGLGLTERLALDIIAKEGSLVARRVFLFSMAERDPQPYHGDIMFFAILNSLWKADEPALKVTGMIDAPGPDGKEILTLTPFGEALLNEKANWLASNTTQRWVGGVEINSSQPKNWTFDDNEYSPEFLITNSS